MLRRNGVEELVQRLERDGKHRVLRRLEVPEGKTGVEYDGGPTTIALVLDVETTGTDITNDVIIELAMRRFCFDRLGRILKIDRTWSWREDPHRPLDDEIVRLTGLTDADLVGQEIDEDAASRLLASADLVIAHNAEFDRKFIDRRFPESVGRAWCCSCREIDWAAAGFDGRSLGWLTAQAGWFYGAHRAGNDVDAVIALLCHELPNGRTALAELVESAVSSTVKVEACGAHFSVKDALRNRGYRWDANQKVWWREVREDALLAEEFWLTGAVYASEKRPRCMGPRLTKLTARERYA